MVRGCGRIQRDGCVRGAENAADELIVTLALIVAPAAIVVEAGKVQVNPVTEQDDELKLIGPLKPSTDVITSAIVPELPALAIVTFGSGDHTERPGAVGQCVVSKFTFTEPSPVARSYPVPASKPSTEPVVVSTPKASPVAVEQSDEALAHGVEFVPAVTS